MFKHIDIYRLAPKFKVQKRLQNTVSIVKKWQKVGSGGNHMYIFLYINIYVFIYIHI